MSARVIDGKAIAAKVRGEVASDAARLRDAGITPGLAVVLVGDDPASHVYVRSKHRAAEQAGVDTFDHKLPADTSQERLLGLIDELNADDRVDGILVQMPVPAQIDGDAVIDRIAPSKDVDGLHPHNLGLLAQKRAQFVACTPTGCMRLLAEAGAKLEGARAVVIGQSNLVGRPMALLLSNANATVTVCHSRTRELAAEVARADVVIAAVGRREFVRGDWIKPGAFVIDVGINRNDEGKLVGDVAYAEAAERAAAITPVPGGVGPMTIAMLLANTVRAAESRRGNAG